MLTFLTILGACVAVFLIGSLAEYSVHRWMHDGKVLAEKHAGHHVEGKGQGWIGEFKDYVLPAVPLAALTYVLGWEVGVGASLGALIGQVRSRSGCCTAASYRSVCAAEVARRRAERSHVVLTNQSFALARPEFFRRVVFDECEHLHDQAMSAWSHRVSFPAIRRVLRRLHEPGAKASKASIGGASENR